MKEKRVGKRYSTRIATKGRRYSSGGLICAIISLFFLPPLFGLIGIILGGVGWKKGDKTFGLIVVILSVVFMVIGMVVGAFIWTSLLQPEQKNLRKVENIVKEYHETHTYSEYDLFVCSDMAIDVWNLVKSKGINAQIYAGNINISLKNIKFEDWGWFNNINHAWVLAEVEPFKWIAVETTGGYLVWGEDVGGENVVKNDLYYYGYAFDNPKEFKRFIELRKDIVEICSEADRLIEVWNKEYVGKEYETYETGQFWGKVEQKREECLEIMNQLRGLLGI